MPKADHDHDPDSRRAAPAPTAVRAPDHTPRSLARRLRLQQFAIFEQVVEAGSILAASRELALTQPALSKAIHELEQHLGGALFARGKRGVALTEFGQLFERRAKALMSELRYMAEDINAWQSGSAGHVVVGSLIVASSTLLPKAILRLRAQAPGIVVTVRVGSNATLFPALARGELDVVVGYMPSATAAAARAGAAGAPLAHVPLYGEAWCAVVGRQHALARRRRLRLRDLSQCDWIVPTPDSTAFAAARALFEHEGLPMPARAVESVSILTNLALVQDSTMVALMQRSAAERFAAAGLLVILPLAGARTNQAVGYTVRDDRAPTAALQCFVAAMHAVGRELQRRG